MSFLEHIVDILLLIGYIVSVRFLVKWSFNYVLIDFVRVLFTGIGLGLLSYVFLIFPLNDGMHIYFTQAGLGISFLILLMSIVLVLLKPIYPDTYKKLLDMLTRFNKNLA